MGEYGLTFKDAASRLSNMNVHTGPINAATVTAVALQVAALQAAIDPIVRGNMSEERFLVDRNRLQVLPPSDQLARVVDRWLVSWVDNTQYLDPPINSIPNPNFQKIYSTHIPTADALLTIDGSNEVDLTVAPWPAFIAAFEAVVRSDSNGGAHVIRIQFVDR